jgi:hypothetical protein
MEDGGKGNGGGRGTAGHDCVAGEDDADLVVFIDPIDGTEFVEVLQGG